MKNKLFATIPLLITLSVMITSCSVIGDIFKAGMWTGTIAVIVVVAIIVFIVAKLFSRNKNV